ncbi:hypothetical protein EV356DRAFT_533528 [Viridothelium virens]|uniref:Chromosome segregation ATPase family protein n=1 Tax=Viridothelium virens TaxID=1048519 RepID=A0A6A6H7I0_VIRVR|nr:hypothetical protein EV356DRAFT_533528 [Viridothelium virens]
MSSREGSRDREMVRHGHSYSETLGRSSVPMWDSSDPDRAPPPLPLNPSSPAPTTKSTASANIAAAAQALAEKARESNGPSQYTSNSSPQKSPERSLIKGAQHKRLQSLQTGNVRDLRSYLDGFKSQDRSPERSPTRTATPSPVKDTEQESYFSSSPERSPSRAETPTPGSRDFLRDTPQLRPSTRSTTRPILGENTPPSSATMLALQTMSARDDDTPLPHITNNASKSLNTDSLSSQLLSLTSIATGLQKEMAQLSRRSRDNATDLIALKEATNARDEDIRKSLRDLATTIVPRSNSSFNLANHFLDAKSHSTPPSGTKSISLPRIPSLNSFTDDRIGSPSPYSVEGAASVAMLEKIIREMVTKEGQERLLSTLSEMQEKTSKENVDTVRKVEQLADFIKEKSSNNALVARGSGGGDGGNGDGQGKLSFENMQAAVLAKYEGTNGKPYASPKAADFVSNEMLKLLKKIKDSTAESGGMTAEVKALVRELRGEVLGMGREIGRKLDEVESSRGGESATAHDSNKEEVNRIIEDGLAELKDHMDRVLREKRRESGASLVSRQSVNNEEVYQVVRHALAEHREADGARALVPTSTAEKEEIIATVRQACEDFKPDITMEYNGLQNEEILTVLREGLEEYQGSRGESAGISREEVMDAVQNAMQHFTPPAQPTEIGEIKEEILAAVHESLEDIRASPHAAVPRGLELTRETVVDAVKECLIAHGPEAPRELEISREHLFAAVKAGLDDTPYGEQVLHQLHALVQGMRDEFQEYSAANGRDTEQVLDAVKDGLESLRAEIESYVDRAQDVTGKDEIVDTVRSGLEMLRVDVQAYCAQGPTGDNALSRSELLDYIKAEFEHLHETVAAKEGTMTNSSASGDRGEMLAAINEGLAAVKASAGRRALDDDSLDEMMDAMKEEFEQLRETMLTGTAAQKDEVVELINEKLASLHSRLESGSVPSGGASSEEAVNLIKEEFAHMREILSGIVLHSGSSSGENEGFVDAVREMLDGVRTQLAGDASEAAAENLGAIKEELEHFRTSIDEKGLTTGDDKPPIDQEVLEAIRGEFEHLRSTIANSMVGGGNRADTEEVLDAVRLGLDDLRSHFEKKLDSSERSMSSTNDILDALNEGLDNIRLDITKTADKPIDMTVSYEILDTLKEGMANVRADLDALKGLRTGYVPSGGEVVLAEDPENVLSRDMPSASQAENGVKASDLEKFEVMLAQLKIKIEAMDANMQDYSAARSTAGNGDGATKEDLDPLATKEDLAEVVTKGDVAELATKVDLAANEELLKELQVAMNLVAGRDLGDTEPLAKKEDTDAIETLLRNTKALLEEMPMSDPEKTFCKDDLDAVEAAVKTSNETLEGLAAKFEGKPVTKEDIEAVELLMQDVKIAVDEVKDKIPEETDEEKISKPDIDAIGVLCTTIVNKISELEIPNEGKLMSKEDSEQLNELLDEFRKSHDKFKSRYETDVAVTAKAFDDRRQEAEDVIERLRDIKSLLKDCKNELKMKVEEDGEGLTGISSKLIAIEEGIQANSGVGADLKELMETIDREFERAHGTIEVVKADQEEKSVAALEKHEEHKDAIIAGIADKIDSIFDDLMSKYDEAQNGLEERAKSMDERTNQQSEMATENKAIAEDLRLNIETLGTTVQELQTTIPETFDRLSDDSKTVYNRIDETFGKIEETHLDAKVEHQQTREEVAKTLFAIDAVQGQVTEFNPQFMDALQEVKNLLQQQYDHSQQMHEQTRAATDESRAQGEDIKNLVSRFHDLPALAPAPSASPEIAPSLDDGPIHEKLNKLVAASKEPQERYDDGPVHEKLDKLVEQATEAKEGISQLDRLDKIHEQVMATAAEVTAFVEIQSKLVSAEHDNKAREAEEAASALARRTAERDAVEASILALNTEKDTLQTTVQALRSECDGLVLQKNKLVAEESSLKTALDFRREELHIMDERASDLEHRILDSIMNQSRAMLLNNQARKKKPSSTQGRDLRRIPSNASTTSTVNAMESKRPSTLDTAHSMAMKTRPPVRRGGAPVSQSNSPANRRIMSLGQISNNTPTGASSRPVPTASLTQGHGVGGLKRSHSVKTQQLRKSSWGGRRSSILETNKENEAFSEESELEIQREGPLQIEDKPVEEAPKLLLEGSARDRDLESIEDVEDGSDTQTERRTSLAESSLTYGTGTDGGSYTEGITPSEDRRTSYGTSDLSYGSGSYITGSDLTDRRTSYGSTIRSTLGALTDAGEVNGGEGEVEPEPEGEKTQDEGQLLLENGIQVDDKAIVIPEEQIPDEKKGLQLFAPPSDSGLGTDLPTATALGGSDYFRRAAEE